MLICSVILTSVASTSLPHFSTSSHKWHDFRKTKMCVLIFHSSSSGNISHSKKNSARYYQKCTLVFMYSNRYFCLILMKLDYSWHIFEKMIKDPISRKSVNWWSCCSMLTDKQADGKTDMTKLIIAFAVLQTRHKIQSLITRWFKYDRDWFFFFVTIIAQHSSNSQTGLNRF